MQMKIEEMLPLLRRTVNWSGFRVFISSFISMKMASTLNFLSLNVGTSSSLAGVATLIESENIDIVFLQEVRVSVDHIEYLLRGFKTVANIDSENSSSPGVAIAWRQNLPVNNVCNLVSCWLQVASIGSLNLMNVYAPSGSSRKGERSSYFTEGIFHFMQLYSNGSWLLGGDFNSVLGRLDVENGIGCEQKKSSVLQDVVSSAHLIDVFRHMYPLKQKFTFYRPNSAASRLEDYM